MKTVTRMKAGFVKVDTDTLERIRDDFRVNGKARVHVGILGGYDERAEAPTVNYEARHDAIESGEDVKEPGAPIGNAALGAVHEFGSISRGIPMRSFLRMPVINEMPAALQATDRRLWHRILIEKGIRGALGLLGAYALDVIHLAFDTGGFGAWAPLKPRTVRRKKSSTILIDSAQLRQAITAEIVDPKQ